jgi:hypothetical protein
MWNKQEEEISWLFEAIAQGDLSVEECLARFPEHRAEITEIFGLAGKLERVSLPEPDPRFRSAARARILSAMHAQKPVTLQDRLAHFWQGAQFFLTKRPALALALILALLFSLTGTGTVFASQGAAPGDLLYPVKLQVEDLRLMAASEAGDEVLYRQFAQERVEEVEGLIARGQYKDIPAAVDRLEILMNGAAEALESGAQEDRPETAAELSHSLVVLTDLLDRVPDTARPGLERAIERVSRDREKLDKLFPDYQPGNADGRTPANLPGGKPEDTKGGAGNDAANGAADDAAGGAANGVDDGDAKGKPEKTPAKLPTQARGVQDSDDPAGGPADSGSEKPEKDPSGKKIRKDDRPVKPTARPDQRPTPKTIP